MEMQHTIYEVVHLGNLIRCNYQTWKDTGTAEYNKEIHIGATTKWAAMLDTEITKNKKQLKEGKK